ncbi:MAG: hypothetical protein NTX25_12720, partial [Proteobacteria bacterium]|nr:hypothetical protein [Pseudomonadota bacterium]
FCLTMRVNCSKDGKKSAHLSLKMSQTETEAFNSPSLLDDLNTTVMKPEYFKLKIIAVELVRTDNKYVAVWVNPDCTPNKWEVDLGETDSLGKAQLGEYYNAEGCSLASINSFVDIAKSAATVNAGLNSQIWPVPPGTYTSVSIRMCMLGDTDEAKAGSLIYKGSTMDAEKSTFNSSCGVTGAPVTAINIAEGITAKIDLNYDVNALLKVNGSSSGQLNDNIDEATRSAGCYYPAGSSIFYCHKFGASTFVPSLVTE